MMMMVAVLLLDVVAVGDRSYELLSVLSYIPVLQLFVPITVQRKERTSSLLSTNVTHRAIWKFVVAVLFDMYLRFASLAGVCWWSSVGRRLSSTQGGWQSTDKMYRLYNLQYVAYCLSPAVTMIPFGPHRGGRQRSDPPAKKHPVQLRLKLLFGTVTRRLRHLIRN